MQFMILKNDRCRDDMKLMQYDLFMCTYIIIYASKFIPFTLAMWSTAILMIALVQYYSIVRELTESCP